jgi:2-hydroxychromene-2-carboxylate isomerase
MSGSSRDVEPTMTSFAVTWDYRCPFARNAHEHLVAGLADGADWDVTFVPFSLGQVHVKEGEAPIWDRPEDDSGLLSLQAGTVVRDIAPDAFPKVHLDLFAARHDHGLHLRDPDVVRDVLVRHGVDADAVFTAIAEGGALDIVRKEHEAAAGDHTVWGVPTFVLGDEAVFVRVMDRPGDDGPHARRTIDRILDLLGGFPELNEFKHTSIKR